MLIAPCFERSSAVVDREPGGIFQHPLRLLDLRFWHTRIFWFGVAWAVVVDEDGLVGGGVDVVVVG